MRSAYRVACFLVLAAASAVGAAPPVELPSEVKGEVGTFVTLRGKTDGKVVRFVALDSGLAVFPADLLADKKATVVSAAKPGRYRVLAYSSVKDDPTEEATVTVVIGDAPLPPDPKPPEPKPPEPKPPGPVTYYFLVVRADGPADPAFTAAMGLPAWAGLRTKGHQYKDKTVSAAAADLALTLPPGTALPAVVTLSTAGGVSKIVRGPVAMPTTDVGVAALLDGVR